MSGCPRRGEARFPLGRTVLAELDDDRLALRKMTQAICGGYGHRDDRDGEHALARRRRWKWAQPLKSPHRRQKSQKIANQEGHRPIRRLRTNLRLPKIPWQPYAELPAPVTPRLQREAYRRAARRLLPLSSSSRPGEIAARKLRTASPRHPAD